MAAALNAARFHDEAAAYAHIEALVWPNGRVCPHCGMIARSGALKGKSTRIGGYKCYACRKPFTVKVGTIFEDSHIPLHVWLQAMRLMASSKKGISANQLGGPGTVVKADETFHAPAVFVTGKGWQKKQGAYAKPPKIVTLVERGGRARSVKVDEGATRPNEGATRPKRKPSSSGRSGRP